ncbi:hypothetical protein HOLleu_26083 [Holothuria leucospilota]|uniref:Uncharacterized protein n=1 Tax=Holothuria leucospilota TaxID=206669 RepID=A0A9Q1H294_HOLLE|nr:hypothetical protein HOLleu_26083 [Holothuria leucospilota]
MLLISLIGDVSVPIVTDRLYGQVVRASDLQPEGLGFKSWPGHTKDFKNGTYCLCTWCSA